VAAIRLVKRRAPISVRTPVRGSTAESAAAVSTDAASGGMIHERLRPSDAEPQRSTKGAQRNFAAHGSARRLVRLMSGRLRPSLRIRTGSACVKKPNGNPCDR
jgi:hypothetical protein